jgi:hypothetical protein
MAALAFVLSLTVFGTPPAGQQCDFFRMLLEDADAPGLGPENIMMNPEWMAECYRK